MIQVRVYNYIDYGEQAYFPNAVFAFFWAVGNLLGPCRSGNADFFRLVDGDYELIKD